MRSARRTAVALVVMALLAAACASSSSTVGAGGTTSAPTSPTKSKSPKPSKSPSTSPSPVIAEGRSFVFVRKVKVSGSGSALTFDLAYFLTGDDAVKAAIKDGVIEPGETLPNDYYIVNHNPLLRTMPIAANVDVRVIDWTNCCDLTKGDFDAWVAAIKSGPGDVYHGTASPYWITVSGGEVVKIEEQYLP